MTPDEHQRERMRAWVALLAAGWNSEICTKQMAIFDAEFPAHAAAPVKPGGDKTFWAMTESEYTSLRQKARLWDAVASGKVRLDFYVYGPPEFEAAYGDGCFTPRFPTAEEAVEAAIAAGATK